MLDAKDLRIGNLIKWITTNTVEVVQEINSCGKYHLINNVQITDAEPIELTEEWLLRFGLTKHNGYPYKFLDGFIKIRNGEYFFKYHNLDIKLNYVHNLQNLHYVITQTELTLKDEK